MKNRLLYLLGFAECSDSAENAENCNDRSITCESLFVGGGCSSRRTECLALSMVN